jgi:hypothetical protein
MTMQQISRYHPATAGHKQHPKRVPLVSGTKCTGKPKQQIKEGGAVSKKRLRSPYSHVSMQELAGNKAGLTREQTLHAVGKIALIYISAQYRR